MPYRQCLMDNALRTMPYKERLIDNTARRQTTLCHLLPLGRPFILVLSLYFSYSGGTRLWTKLSTLSISNRAPRD